MRTRMFNLLTGIVFLTVLQSCEDHRMVTYTANVPVYLSYDELRKAIVIRETEPIVEPGKIYFKDNYIYLNEFMKGVHVIDISDPSTPTQVCFIPVPGNVEMAIKDNILYLDSYTDLVLIDVSDPGKPAEKDRIEDILEYTLPPYDTDYPVASVDEDKGVVTGWKIEEYTEEINYNPSPWPVYYEYEDIRITNSAGVSGGSAITGYGIGGSMARFLTYDKYLYMLQTDYNLKVFDISDIENPELTYDKYVGWGLETMFIDNDYMYIGASNGLYILSLENPGNPYTKSMYSHITSCDPVVVNGNYAYVTLRSGNTCGATADLLEVIDISDKYSPGLIASYAMKEPYGLGISGHTLFICQGSNGLSVYNTSDPYHIGNNKLAEFKDIHATDVIPFDHYLFTIGETGFYIYDFSTPEDITLTGTLEITETE